MESPRKSLESLKPLISSYEQDSVVRCNVMGNSFIVRTLCYMWLIIQNDYKPYNFIFFQQTNWVFLLVSLLSKSKHTKAFCNKTRSKG